MAKLTQEKRMFSLLPARPTTDVRIAALNFELQDALGESRHRLSVTPNGPRRSVARCPGDLA